MDWTTIIVTTVTTIGTVLVAWLALRKEMAKLSETATEAKHKAEEAAVASHKTEQSINNRPTSMSDRVDEVGSAVSDVSEAVKSIVSMLDSHGNLLEEHGRDIRGVRDSNLQTRRDIGLLHGEDRAGRNETQQLRKDLTEHVEQTAPMMPMLEALYRQYVNGKPK